MNPRSIIQRIVALSCAEKTGRYCLQESSVGMEKNAGEEFVDRRVEYLRKLDELEKKKISLRSALKKESQFNQRLELNMKIKKLALEMDSVKEQL